MWHRPPLQLLTDEASARRGFGVTLPEGVRTTVLTDTVDSVEEEDLDAVIEGALAPSCDRGGDGGALILYTSGTTGQPKGVLHSHRHARRAQTPRRRAHTCVVRAALFSVALASLRRSLGAQAGVLCEAWRWRQDDVMLHALPLHHIHGLVNGVLCALHSGASLEFTRFDARRIWRRLARGDITVFMGVPTMYAHLLRVLDKMPAAERPACARAAAALRLAVSGSAACPLPVMDGWTALTGEVRIPFASLLIRSLRPVAALKRGSRSRA